MADNRTTLGAGMSDEEQTRIDRMCNPKTLTPETTDISTFISDELTNGLKDRGEATAAREIERLRHAIHDHKVERSRLLGALRGLQLQINAAITEALNG